MHARYGLPQRCTLIDFSQHTWLERGIVRGEIGQDSEPVLAIYVQGTLDHFAMSQAYIVHEG
jgi:hypothetical protein